MKTIYINENILKNDNFKKEVLLNTLPDDIISKILKHKTSLGNNPSIPDIFDEPFLLKIVEIGFEETKNKLKEIGSIDDVNGTDLEEVLSELILKCKKIETPYRSELEKICVNTIIDLFSIPEEVVDISVSLCDEIDMSNKNILLEPNSFDDNLETVNDAISIKKEVYKRRLLNALCCGGAMRLSTIYRKYENEINKIDSNLIDLYNKIISLNNYLLYTKEDFNINDKNNMQIGLVELSLSTSDRKPKIDAQGVIFPILLSELIKGFMELFISHGLPKDLNKATIVINKSDFIKAEPWDMKLGPILWNLFSDSFNDINTIELPYLMKKISELDIDKFNFLMKEIFAKTRKGKEIMSKLSYKSKHDAEYDKFVDKMTKMKADKGIITDDYIHPDEL